VNQRIVTLFFLLAAFTGWFPSARAALPTLQKSVVTRVESQLATQSPETWELVDVQPYGFTDDGTPLALFVFVELPDTFDMFAPVSTRAGPETHTRVLYVVQPVLGLDVMRTVDDAGNLIGNDALRQTPWKSLVLNNQSMFSGIAETVSKLLDQNIGPKGPQIAHLRSNEYKHIGTVLNWFGEGVGLTFDMLNRGAATVEYNVSGMLSAPYEIMDMATQKYLGTPFDVVSVEWAQSNNSFGGPYMMLDDTILGGAIAFGRYNRAVLRGYNVVSDVRIPYRAPTAVSKLDYVPTSGVSLQGQAGRTTTILGNYQMDMRHIIDELGNVKSLDFGPNPGGFNILNVPDELYINPNQFWNGFNRPWLDEALFRGDNFIYATDPAMPVLRRLNPETGMFELSGFGREYLHLRRNGASSSLSY
jgi:hypothetical protein